MAAETVTIDGMTLYHTHRGYNQDIEAYTRTQDNITYSLYRKPNESIWRCDWSKSYNNQPIELAANPTDGEGMLKAFVALLKAAQVTAH